MSENMASIICRIPEEREFSLWSMIEQSGYLEDPGSLTLSVLAEELRRTPELIESWLHYDDRFQPWSIEKDGGLYRVAGPDYAEAFEDPVQACAILIWNRIADSASREKEWQRERQLKPARKRELNRRNNPKAGRKPAS